MWKIASAESGDAVLSNFTVPHPRSEIQQCVFTGYVLHMKRLRARRYYITSWLHFGQCQWVLFKGALLLGMIHSKHPFLHAADMRYSPFKVSPTALPSPQHSQLPLCHTWPATHTFSFILQQHNSAGLHFQHFRYFALPKHTQIRTILSECPWGGTWRPAKCCFGSLWSFCSTEDYMEQGSFSGPSK